MNDDWKKYLESIGVVDLFYNRACKVIEFYERLYPNELKHIFISEYVDKEGMRQYENMWLFTENYAFEAKGFLRTVDFDASPMKKYIEYWNIKKDNFDFDDLSKDSRMVLTFHLRNDSKGELKASADNCTQLMKIFEEMVIPNIVIPA
jgi:hypothetical protein